MDQKTIIVVTETLGVDGPERVISALMNEWHRMGYDIKAVITRAELREATYQVSENIELHYIDAHKKGGPLARINEIRDLRKILKKYPNAIGISFLVSTSFSLAMASRGLKIRVILSERNDPHQVPFTSLQRKMRDLSMEMADACVFQTLDAKAYFSEKVQKKGTIIYNPVNPSLPERYTGERKKVFVAAGRLARQKNYPMMLKAFSKITKEYPEYKLLILGEGPDREELENLVQSLGIADQVKMPGFSNNVYAEMTDCAAYVSSSDFEGMSNSMLEALAMGIPTICTDCPIGGAKTVIQDKENGLLVPIGDEAAMYNAMKLIIEHPDVADSMGQKAYELSDKLNIHDIADTWTKLF